MINRMQNVWDNQTNKNKQKYNNFVHSNDHHEICRALPSTNSAYEVLSKLRMLYIVKQP
jgi:hypothetical protein